MKKKTKKKVLVTQEYIDQLKRERERYRKDYEHTLQDLNKHRDYFVRTLRSAIEVHGKGMSISTSWLIESLSKHMNAVQKWYWS